MRYYGVLVSVTREHSLGSVSCQNEPPARIVVVHVLYLVAGHPVGGASAALCRHRMDHTLGAQGELQIASDVISRDVIAD